MKSVNQDALTGTPIELRYVRVKDVLFWDNNPKKHSLDAIIGSIKEHGFRDPSAYDATLNGLVEGNGRAEALSLMQKNKFDVPRGILVDKETGDWCMPVLFGIDAPSKLAAERYAIDHNNLTMLGGDFTAYDMAKMWETAGYKSILGTFKDAKAQTFSLDANDIHMILNASVINPDVPSINDNSVGDGDSTGTVSMGQVIIRYSNTDYASAIFNTIQGIIEDNPEWGAKIVSGAYK